MTHRPATPATAYFHALEEGDTRPVREAALTAATWLRVIQDRVRAERQEADNG